MKTKILLKRAEAFYTHDPGEIARLISECDKITMPDALYATAADVADTIRMNTRRDGHEHEQAAIMANYVLRYALILHREGRLTEAPPKPPRLRKKPEDSAV